MRRGRLSPRGSTSLAMEGRDGPTKPFPTSNTVLSAFWPPFSRLACKPTERRGIGKLLLYRPPGGHPIPKRRPDKTAPDGGLLVNFSITRKARGRLQSLADNLARKPRLACFCGSVAGTHPRERSTYRIDNGKVLGGSSRCKARPAGARGRRRVIHGGPLSMPCPTRWPGQMPSRGPFTGHWAEKAANPFGYDNCLT